MVFSAADDTQGSIVLSDLSNTNKRNTLGLQFSVLQNVIYCFIIFFCVDSLMLHVRVCDLILHSPPETGSTSMFSSVTCSLGVCRSNTLRYTYTHKHTKFPRIKSFHKFDFFKKVFLSILVSSLN